MANRFLDEYDRAHGYTVLTDEQRWTIHDAIYRDHSKQEIMNFATKHGIEVAKSWKKVAIADTIVSGLRKSGIEYEIMLSMVTTPSSYLEHP